MPVPVPISCSGVPPIDSWISPPRLSMRRRIGGSATLVFARSIARGVCKGDAALYAARSSVIADAIAGGRGVWNAACCPTRTAT